MWKKTIYTKKRKYLTTEENMKIVKKRNGTSHLFEGSDDERKKYLCFASNWTRKEGKTLVGIRYIIYEECEQYAAT